MADTVQEILDVPKEFVKDGTQFIKRCQKRMFLLQSPHGEPHLAKVY